MARTCPSGKKLHASADVAAGYAKASARRSNREGVLSVNLYAYRCPMCSKWHLTRRPTWGGITNVLVFVAPPLELQRWAMGGGS